MKLFTQLQQTSFLLASLIAFQAHSASVGGAGCDYSSIQAAIDNAETTILLAKEKFNETIVIDDVSIDFIGGYADCDATINGSPTGRTIIDARSGGLIGIADTSTVLIKGDTNTSQVSFASIDITGGHNINPLFPGTFDGGGGILISNAKATVILSNVDVYSNTSSLGGGIAILEGQSNLFLFNSFVRDNTASTGGGVYCRPPAGAALASIVSVAGVSGISNNQATSGQTPLGDLIPGDGGGLYLTNACDFTIYSGTATPSQNDLRGILYNKAVAQGGGVYADLGAKVNLIGSNGFFQSGDDTNPVSLVGNIANSDASGTQGGGGVYITGVFSELNANDALIAENRVLTNNALFALFHGKGGAISANDGAIVKIDRLEKKCWNESHCNLIRNNFAPIGDGGSGGAIYNNDASVEVVNAVFHHNSAGNGNVLLTQGASATTTINSSVLYANGLIPSLFSTPDDKYVLSTAAGSKLNVYHSTFADNNANDAVIGIADNSGAVSIQSSIIQDTSSVLPYNKILNTTENCNIFHKLADQFQNLPFSFIGDPLFIDAANNNYHIHPVDSPAIDFCASTFGFKADIDFENRGIDNPNVNDFLGPYDIGADETNNNEIIFKNGFE